MQIKKRAQRKAKCIISLAGLLISLAVNARGVSPYLPLNLAPDIERKIERVLILGDKPIMRRPIAAAIVLEALPKACQRDEQLCEEVRNYLDRYMHTAKITQLQGELAATSGKSIAPIPNQHGMPVDSRWGAVASAYYQPSDYLLLNGGAVAYQGRVNPTGSVISAGFDFAQLDIGYRDHWFSPNTDSSMLMSTEAPTMPSITLSNYRPLTRFGFNYELFFARMSEQNGISYKDTTTNGHPNLAGLQLGIEPADGYALSVNRLMQYGGGARGGANLHEFYKALFDNTAANRSDSALNTEFGNQQAAVTASALFQARVPFAVHIEYAAEDNAFAGNKYFGDTDLTFGLDFPKLLGDYDLTYEISEWQNAWYVHHLYPDGMRNDGYSLGHWFADQRIHNNDIGGHSQMLRMGRRFGVNSYLQLTYRDLEYDPRWAGVGASVPAYKQYHEMGLRYSSTWRGHSLSTEASTGQDIFGKSFARLSGSFDFTSLDNHASAFEDTQDNTTTAAIFVDVGVSRNRVTKILAVDIPNVTTANKNSYHFGFGARRPISDHGDMGVRIEFDQADEHGLISLRALDYRYRFTNHFALGGFFGAARYSIGLPAYGWYTGYSAQIINLFKYWDVNLDWSQYHKLGRDKVLAYDPPSTPDRTRVFYDVEGIRLFLSRRF